MKKILTLFLFTCTIWTSSAQQTDLNLGDIAFIAYNSDSTVPTGVGNDQFGFVCLVDILASTTISFTDQGWYNTGGFRPEEETTIVVTLTSALSCGDQVYIDNTSVKNQDGSVVGNFTGSSLSFPISGDQIFAYQGSAPTSNSPAELSKFIAAIHMNCSSCTTTNWDGDATSTTTSAKPSVFIAAGTGVNTTYFASEVDNAKYDCSTNGFDPVSIGAAIYTQGNWDTDNSSGFAAADCSFACAILPVELTRFEGEWDEKGIKLTWQTESEINNLGYEIQRSDDTKNWQTITFIERKGNKFQTQDYTFHDPLPRSEINYYRLKQIDLDGGYDYSDVIVIVGSKKEESLVSFSIYPNPISKDQNNLKVQFSNLGDFINGDFRIYTESGILIKNIKVMTPSIDIDISSFSHGIYILKLVSDSNNWMEKLVITV